MLCLPHKNDKVSLVQKHCNIIGGLLLLALVSCEFRFPGQHANQREISFPLVFTVGEQPLFEPLKLAHEIQNMLQTWDNSPTVDSVRSFYAQRKYIHRWISVSDTANYKTYIEVLASAQKNGLYPNAYYYERIQTNIENLIFFFQKRNIIDYVLWAETEIMLSEGLANYAKHLSHGVIDPMCLNDYNYHITPSKNIFSYTNLFNTNDVKSFFNNITPHNMQYALLSDMMENYLLVMQPNNDTLNKIRVNMERWRWYHTNTTKYVYVNIPEYKLYFYENDSLLLSSRIVVGIKKNRAYKRAYQTYLNYPNTERPYPNETPEFTGSIAYIVLNPSWNIPLNIVKKEIFHHILKDSNYLDRQGYVVYRGSKIIDAHSVDWKQYNPKHLPFFFVQPPSDSNALGKMKIMFPNKFNVYLHDTRNRQDFNRQMKALSHGCIRVENYLDLAEKLLNSKKYTKKYLSEKMNDNEKTTNIFLHKRYEIWLDYKTAAVDADGNLALFNDVYEKDNAVLEKLDATVKVDKY